MEEKKDIVLRVCDVLMRVYEGNLEVRASVVRVKRAYMDGRVGAKEFGLLIGYLSQAEFVLHNMLNELELSAK